MKHNGSDILVGITIFGFFITLIELAHRYNEMTPEYLSITSVFIWFITPIFLILFLLKKWSLRWIIADDISQLDIDILKHYHSELISILRTIFTALAFILAILWGIFNVSYGDYIMGTTTLTDEGLAKFASYNPIEKFEFQTGMVVIFFFYVALCLYFTFGPSLKNQIEDKCKKGQEERISIKNDIRMIRESLQAISEKKSK